MLAEAAASKRAAGMAMRAWPTSEAERYQNHNKRASYASDAGSVAFPGKQLLPPEAAVRLHCCSAWQGAR